MIVIGKTFWWGVGYTLQQLVVELATFCCFCFFRFHFRYLCRWGLYYWPDLETIWFSLVWKCREYFFVGSVFIWIENDVVEMRDSYISNKKITSSEKDLSVKTLKLIQSKIKYSGKNIKIVYNFDLDEIMGHVWVNYTCKIEWY